MASTLPKTVLDFNKNDKSFPETIVTELIEKSCEKTPNSTAVVCGKKRISFEQLNTKASNLSFYLKEHLTLENTIGILLDNSIEMIISLFAVLKAGAAYIPIDPSYPPKRVQYMLGKAGAKLLITTKNFNEYKFKNIKNIYLDDANINYYNNTNVPDDNYVISKNINKAKKTIYILFTSGSTGNPKGASLNHSGVANLLDWYINSHQFNCKDKNYIVSSFGFDLSQKNILASLISGGELHIRDNNEFNPEEIINYIYANKISCVNCTPSALYSLVEHAAKITYFSSLRYIFLGGEPINTKLLQPFLEIFNTTKIVNTYGPTECSDLSCTYLLSFDDIHNHLTIPVGSPIQNTKILVLDDELNAMPIGSAGEIYLAGIGIGDGYVNNVSLTKERFLQNPYKKSGKNWNSLLYKTGDLGYWRKDGTVVCLGRTDDQIKLRGFRIELNEIDENLCLLGVKQSVSVLKGTSSKKYIITYVLSHRVINSVDLKRNLLKYLPKYMLPEKIIQLKKFPINIHGKIDKQALQSRVDNVSESTNKTSLELKEVDHDEKIILDAWSHVLERCADTIGLDDTYINLGGYSILMARVALRVKKVYQKQLPLRIFIENSTVKKQAQAVRDFFKLNSTTKENSISISNKKTIFPLSAAQRRIYFIHQLYPNLSLYNLPALFSAKGPLDILALKRSLTMLMKKHQALRLSFILLDNDVMQKECPVKTLDAIYNFIDYSDLGNAEAKRRISLTIEAEANKPIDLFSCPLWRITLFKIDEVTHEIFFNFHHAIFDGWSWTIFKKELSELYAINSTHKTKKNEASTVNNLSDYIEQENNKKISEKNCQYWTEKLSNLKSISLPYDKNISLSQPFRGALKQFTLSRSLYKKLSCYSKEKKFSLFQIFHSVFNLLLYLMGGGDDQAICISLANRPTEELENMIGFFVNTLILRTKINHDMSIDQLLLQNKSIFLDAIDHQDLAFEKLVEQLNPKRILEKNPISQVLFIFQNSANRELSLENLSCQQTYIRTNSSRFELEWQMWPESNGIHLDIFFNDTLFSEKIITFLFEGFVAILSQIVDKNINNISQLKLPEFYPNDSTNSVINLPKNFPGDSEERKYHDKKTINLYEKFYSAAKNNLNKPAINFSGDTYTYGELLKIISIIGQHLYQAGIRQGSLVAICLQENGLIPAIYLAILKLGATFLPLDIRWPSHRKSYVLSDSRAAFYITDTVVFPDNFNGKIINLDFEQLIKRQKNIDCNQSTLELKLEVTEPNYAYVIYTSGSTGSPKGVAVSWAAIEKTFSALQSELNFSSSDHFAALTSSAFDISLVELLFPLMISAQVTIFSRETKNNPEMLVQELMDPALTVIQATPTLWRFLFGLGWAGHRNLTILCGGENLEINLARRLVKNSLNAWNLYGPTETCIWSSLKRLSLHDDAVSIGFPLSHTTYTVLDNDEKPVPDGADGMLYISGENLAEGYIGRECLSGNKFKVIQLASGKIKRMYETGDIVCQNTKNKEFFFKGRKDAQVKISGYRVELTEIEAHILQHPLVIQASVIYHSSLLVAFIVLDKKAKLFDIEQSWNQIFNATYALKDNDTAENDAYPGWVSRLTGKPFPKAEMDNWLDDVESKLLMLDKESAFKSKRILEIGCGAGQLAMRMVPRCEFYLATDSSHMALDLIRKKYKLGLPNNLELKQASAISTFSAYKQFDIIVLNSVIQYFPDFNYLWETLQSLGSALAPGGKFFIGDIRDLSCLDDYKKFISSRNYPQSVEHELMFDRKFFSLLQKEVPWIDDVEVFEKLFTRNNELSLFRYDVVLSKKAIPALKLTKHELPSNEIASYVLQPESSAFANEKNSIYSADINKYLAQRLPGYMVPAKVITLGSLPMTTTGKVDKNKLVACLSLNNRESNRNKLISIWKSVLQVSQLTDNSNFFHQGGHSFLAITLLQLVEQEFSIKVELYEFYAKPIFSVLLESIAIKQEKRKTASASIKPELIRLNHYVDGLPEVYCIHPIDGQVGWYSELANLLHNQFNIIGIKQGRMRKKASVEVMAKTYLSLIYQHKRLNKKIILFGWSLGALIAYEMVIQAKESAQHYCDLSIDLYLIDPPCSELYLDEKIKLENDKSLMPFKHNLACMLSYAPRKIADCATLFFAEKDKPKDKLYEAEKGWCKHFNKYCSYKLPSDHYKIISAGSINFISKIILEKSTVD